MGGVGPAANEDEIRSQLELYVPLIEHAPDAIVVLDVDDGRFVSASEPPKPSPPARRRRLLG